MKQIEVRKQVRLPLSKCVELVLSGIRFRLFRAAITVIIISLAAAFLMTMLTEGLVGRQVRDAINQQLRPRQQFSFWSAYMVDPLSEQELTDLLSQAAPQSSRWPEVAAWGKCSDEQLRQLSNLSSQALAYLDFFKQLPEGQRRQFVERATGLEIFNYLSDEANFQRFSQGLGEGGKKFPTDTATFEAFLKSWQATQPQRQEILNGHDQARQAVRQYLGDRDVADELARGDPGLFAVIKGAGFTMSQDDQQTVGQEAKAQTDIRRITRLLNIQSVKARLADQRNVQIADANAPMLFSVISSKDGAQWLVNLVTELRTRLQAAQAKKASGEQRSVEEDNLLASATLIQSFNYNAEQVLNIGRLYREDQRLNNIDATLKAATGRTGWLGFSTRTLWLIMVSFLVCVVGIANAMLMSVTERFREIATMKCLGATDGFIMINFILESMLQGVAGGVIGTILGFGLGLLRAIVTYGLISLSHLSLPDLLQAAVVSFVISIVVSALAAVYPARVAARLAPMEAMRIE